MELKPSMISIESLLQTCFPESAGIIHMLLCNDVVFCEMAEDYTCCSKMLHQKLRTSKTEEINQYLETLSDLEEEINSYLKSHQNLII